MNKNSFHKPLFSYMFKLMLKNKLNIFVIILMFFYIINFVFRKIVLAGISGFLPLVDLKAVNYYPVVFMGQMFNIMLAFLFIFYICAVYGTYIENKNIVLPLFYGYTRKNIFRYFCVSIFAFIFCLILICFVIFQISGLPLEVLYMYNKEIFKQYGALRGPISAENAKLSLIYLIFQYISILPILSFTILINTIVKRKVISGGISGGCYLLIQFFSMQFEEFEKFSCYFYQENFFKVIVIGDNVSLSYLPGITEYLIGVCICTLSTLLLLKIAQKCFVSSQF